MRNLLLKLSYDGKRYHGWQIQENALAVQEVFQNALEQILGQRPDIKGCSRTDSGVHAYEYYVSLKTDHGIPCERLVGALNHFLPKDMAVYSCREMPLDFHARYSCSGKEYIYKIWNHPVRDPFLDGYVLHYWYPLDEKMLDEAARCYLGAHDFTSFCTLDQRDAGDLVRTVTRSTVERQGHMVTFTVAADGFLYNMVRIMAGTLVEVGLGKRSADSAAVPFETLDRTDAGETLPAKGLTLAQIEY